MFQPSQAGIVVHVFRNVGMIGAHDGYFLPTRVLNQVQSGTVGTRNVNQGGLKVAKGLFLHSPTQRKADLVGQFGIVRIMDKGNPNAIV